MKDISKMDQPNNVGELIENESLTDALQNQVAFYKSEYDNLKLETKTLIAENSEMSKQIDSLISKNKEIENFYYSHENDRDIIGDLRKQLIIANKEKGSYESLWKTSENTIKTLEKEMRTYQLNLKTSATQGNNEEYKHEYSSIIKMLENKLAIAMEDIKSREESLTAIKEEKELVVRKMNDKERDLIKCKEEQSDFNTKIINLEKEVFGLRKELQVAKENLEESLNNMKTCKHNIDIHTKKEIESRNKVAEALLLVEAAISERDSALEREKNAIDESTRLSNQVTKVLNESTFRIQKEVELARQGYNEKLNDMLIHIQRVELEMTEKNLELERALRECSILEEKLQNSRSLINSDEKDSKILLLEQKLEAAFQQLILSERRNIQIVSEKENLQMDMDQLLNNFQRDKRKREWEEKLHLNEINSLKIQINNLKDNLQDAHQSIQRLQTHIISREDIEEKLVNEKFNIAAEFEKQLETQRKQDMKWKQSMKEITAKLEKKVEEFMIQIKHLEKENKQLRNQNASFT